MIYDVYGVIHQIGQERRGVSGAGKEWKCADVVFEVQTNSNYIDHVSVTFFNERLDTLYSLANAGGKLLVSFSIDAKQSNDGRWFNSLTATKVEIADFAQQPQVAQQPVQMQQPQQYQQPQQPQQYGCAPQMQQPVAPQYQAQPQQYQPQPSPFPSTH